MTTVDPVLDPEPGELPGPAQRPTLYFVGVTTGRSSIRPVFPHWAQALGLGDVPLVGVDLPLHAPTTDYRRVVEFLAADPLSAGALVTTHKIDLFEACTDLFAEVDPLARLMGEVSCLAKRDGRLVASAKDPISCGLALDTITPPGYFVGWDADVLLLGAGGSAIAISWYLTRPERGADRPTRVVVTDPDPDRLAALQRLHADAGTDVPVECRPVAGPTNETALAALAPGSLVVNATGLGKDAPGSPLGANARFPDDAVAWDLNYRGDLVFLDQARAAGHVEVHDGWEYFLHGWTQVIAEVFAVAIDPSGPQFAELGRIAAQVRR